MYNKEWTYQCNKEIRNFKDLEMEKQRIQLYQKFLKQLLKQDKIAFKLAMEPQNLLSFGLSNFSTNSTNKNNKNTSSSIIAGVINWIFKKLFKR